MKIYFLGGSFDPPHLGHLRIAEYFSQQCDLFLFIPAQKSPFKKNNPLASPIQRIEMLSLLTEKVNNYQIESFELESNNPSYTYLTVEYLIKKYSPESLNMIIGKDNLISLNKWKNINYISQKCNIVCMDREIENPSSTLNQFNTTFVNFNQNISSTHIRKLLINKHYSKLNKLVENNVLNYIINNNLYN